jgi:hypothetical protein
MVAAISYVPAPQIQLATAVDHAQPASAYQIACPVKLWQMTRLSMSLCHRLLAGEVAAIQKCTVLHAACHSYSLREASS